MCTISLTSKSGYKRNGIIDLAPNVFITVVFNTIMCSIEYCYFVFLFIINARE